MFDENTKMKILLRDLQALIWKQLSGSFTRRWFCLIFPVFHDDKCVGK